MQETPVQFLGRKIPWRRDRLSTPVFLDFPGGSGGKESACNEEDLSSVPGLGRSPGEGNGYPLQYSGLENSTDCIVHGVLKSQTGLSDFQYVAMEKIKPSVLLFFSTLWLGAFLPLGCIFTEAQICFPFSMYCFMLSLTLEVGRAVFIIMLVFFFLAAPHSRQDLSSLTRKCTHAPCSESMESYHWTIREFPLSLF